MASVAATTGAAAEAGAGATTITPARQQHSGGLSGSPSEELPRNINQNLIMSPELGSSFAAVSAAALTAPEQRSPSSSFSSSSSSSSGSSITSFDSNNLIDDKSLPQQPQQHLQQQRQQQQQRLEQVHQQHSRIQAKDTAGPYPIAMHRPEQHHVENHLEATHSIDGADNMFSTPMYFGTENSTVVTTQIGATAHVPCTVHHIGEGVVSKQTHTHTDEWQE